MKIETVHDLIPYERNAKIHDEIQIIKIANSIKAFGFRQAVLIDSKGVIVVGHGRVEGAKKLGISKVKNAPFAKKDDDFIPYQIIDDLTEEEIKAYRLADNKLNESDWDLELVQADVKDLSTNLQEITGFKIEELMPSFDPVDSEMAKLDEKKQVECPSCNFVFTP